MWKKIEADGFTWQVSALDSPEPGSGARRQLLEFRAEEANLPARRLLVEQASVEDMDDDALRRAFAQARPLGGDHYGRPGKRMTDAGSEPM